MITKDAINTKAVQLAPRRARSQAPPPRSCDTFVALPPATPDGSVVFGKNSDRLKDEVQVRMKQASLLSSSDVPAVSLHCFRVEPASTLQPWPPCFLMLQEVVAYAAAEHPPGASVRCTYISIPQAERTLAVVLSKPTWMWGAEMGANQAGVVCGNEAVWTVEDADGPPALLGMDLVRWGSATIGGEALAFATTRSLPQLLSPAGLPADGVPRWLSWEMILRPHWRQRLACRQSCLDRNAAKQSGPSSQEHPQPASCLQAGAGARADSGRGCGSHFLAAGKTRPGGILRGGRRLVCGRMVLPLAMEGGWKAGHSAWILAACLLSASALRAGAGVAPCHPSKHTRGGVSCGFWHHAAAGLPSRPAHRDGSSGGPSVSLFLQHEGHITTASSWLMPARPGSWRQRADTGWRSASLKASGFCRRHAPLDPARLSATHSWLRRHVSDS